MIDVEGDVYEYDDPQELPPEVRKLIGTVEAPPGVLTKIENGVRRYETLPAATSYSIEVNGHKREFKSLDEMPPDIRRLVEGALSEGPRDVRIERRTVYEEPRKEHYKVQWEGKTLEFDGLDKMPPDMRAAIERALKPGTGGPPAQEPPSTPRRA
jgi:hypothetical protein